MSQPNDIAGRAESIPESDDHHWSNYAERCVHCGFEPSPPDSLWQVAESDAPGLIYECPQCGSTVDVGRQA